MPETTPLTTPILVVGEALIDIVHAADGTVAEHPGGSPANVALTLARLGEDAHLLTWIGEDAYGSIVRRWLDSSGVTLVPQSTCAAKTSVAVARLDPSGSAQYEFDLEWRLPREPELPPAVAVHTGSIAATVQPGADDVLALLQRASARSTISYDPNIRPTLMGRHLAVAPKIEAIMMASDIVKVSDEDLAWLYPHRKPEVSGALWHKRSGAPIVMTRGKDGAIAWTRAGTVEVAGVDVTVADTVGAGDSFMGALLHGLARAGLLGAAQRSALRGIDTDTMKAILQRCARVAAITVSRAGANPPRLSEL